VTSDEPWEPPPIKSRRAVSSVAVTIVVLFGALVIAVGLWGVTRLADPVPGPAPLQLAPRIRAAHLGCTVPFVVRNRGDLSLDNSRDEVDCGSGTSEIVIVRFDSQRHAVASTGSYLCNPPSPARANHSYVLGSHWIVYAVSASSTAALGVAVDGRVRRACG
jgi:hypothetical protein